MASLIAKIRKNFGKKNEKLKKEGFIPAVLYGPKIKSIALAVDSREFKKIYKEAGSSTMVKVEIKDNFANEEDKEKNSKKSHLAFIYDVQYDPLTGEPIHIDFYQPILAEEVEVSVPLVFEGESLAVKNLGGTLVKEIQEIEVKSLPEHIPHEIKVDISKLETFSDEILVKDLRVPNGVKIEREEEDVVAVVVAPRKAEEAVQEEESNESDEKNEKEGEANEDKEKE